MDTVSDGGRLRVNVSAGSQRTLPRALVLALLVGGSGGFLAQGHQARADVGGAPGHQRVDLDDEPAADSVPTALVDTAVHPLPAVGRAGAGLRSLVPVPAPALPPRLLPAAGPLAGPLADPFGIPLAHPLAAPLAHPLAGSSAESLRVPALFPVGVPGVAAVSTVGSPGAGTGTGAAPGAAPAGQESGGGRHAARTRPADTGRSAHRHPGEHRAHSHRRDLPATPHTTGELNWSALARCEAGGNPHAVDPSGRYGGLYQFDGRTWRSLGGHGLPQDASAGEQTARARELYQRRGLAPWPACGPRAAG